LPWCLFASAVLTVPLTLSSSGSRYTNTVRLASNTCRVPQSTAMVTAAATVEASGGTLSTFVEWMLTVCRRDHYGRDCPSELVDRSTQMPLTSARTKTKTLPLHKCNCKCKCSSFFPQEKTSKETMLNMGIQLHVAYHITWEEMEGERNEDRKIMRIVTDSFL